MLNMYAFKHLIFTCVYLDHKILPSPPISIELMGRLKQLRIFNGVLKDKASLIKTTLSTKRQTSFIRRAILRATTHSSSSPPSSNRIDAVISSGNGSRPRACTCNQALMDRLHGTRDTFVALKCLYTIHNIITKDSFILKDQLSIFPTFGGRNFLNLSEFHDDSDPESWELSAWIRWYATVLEQNLTVSRVLGYHLSSSDSKKNHTDKEEKVFALLSSDLLIEIDALVGFVQEISNVPNSLHLQRNNLVYEIVRLVSDDYRRIQREISLRVVELDERMTSLSVDQLTLFMSALKKFEDCKERLSLLFVNRKKNDGLWHLIGETKMKIETTMNKKAEEMALVRIIKRDETREWGRQPFRFTSDCSWLGLDRVSLTVSTVR